MTFRLRLLRDVRTEVRPELKKDDLSISGTVLSSTRLLTFLSSRRTSWSLNPCCIGV